MDRHVGATKKFDRFAMEIFGARRPTDKGTRAGRGTACPGRPAGYRDGRQLFRRGLCTFVLTASACTLNEFGQGPGRDDDITGGDRTVGGGARALVFAQTVVEDRDCIVGGSQSCSFTPGRS